MDEKKKYDLNEIEQDLIEFIQSKRPEVGFEYLAQVYVRTRYAFKFNSESFEQRCREYHSLFRLFFDNTSEKQLIQAYQFHAPLHLFRMISYSFEEAVFSYLWTTVKRKKFRKLVAELYRWLVNKRPPQIGRDFHKDAEFILNSLKCWPPVVLDYGCGLAYTSFEIGKLEPKSHIYLLDIDCLTLDFALFRFRKHDLSVEAIRVTEDDPYPSLPSHNVCIAEEVFEHLLEPIVAFENIRSSMVKGGVLWGNFEDHGPELYHVTQNLEKVREVIKNDFEYVEPKVSSVTCWNQLYRKR